MNTVTVERDGERPLQFVGERLATTNTWREGKNVWTELVLWLTDSEAYVLQAIGRTDDPSKVDLFSATVHHSPEQLYQQLTKNGSGGTLSAPARELLELAADEDEFLDTLLDQMLSTPEQI